MNRIRNNIWNILQNKTLNSAIWYTLSSMLAKGISILLTPIFARILTKAEYGYYTSFVSWQSILVTVFSLELASTVLRAKFDYSEEEFNYYIFSVTIFGVIFSSVCISIGAFGIGGKSIDILGIERKYVIPLGTVIIFSPLIEIFQAEQRAKVRYKLSSFITIGYGVMGLAVPLFLTAICNNKLEALLYGVALNALFCGGIILITNTIKCGRLFKWKYIKYALILAIPIVPHLVSSNIMGNSDKLMINSICGPDYAALYGVIYTCSMAITLLRNALNNAWVPWFYKKMSEEEYNIIRKISNQYIFWFSAGSFIVCLLGKEIVLVMGGEQYLEAAPLVPVIMLGGYYNFLNVFFVNIEFYYKKTFMISLVTVGTTILNIFLNYVCIMRFGYMAAAYTTAFCNFIIVLMHYFVTKKMNNKVICDSKLIFFLSVIGLICCLACIFSYNNVLLRITLGILSIFVILILACRSLKILER